jgi:hypothetical protein
VGWTMLYLFVFLKLPIVAACWIVWWAIKQDTDTTDAEAPRDGGSPRPRRPHPRPRRPRPPRRGGGGRDGCGAHLAPPPRTRAPRTLAASGRPRAPHQ